MKKYAQINGVPWPKLPNSPIPLKSEYLMSSMDYLDSEEAKEIFSAQADIVQKNQLRGIVDVGCRVGRINDILHERGYTDYSYMGFDTSPEPIQFSQTKWRAFENIEYRRASWDDRENLAVNFQVDCVIWSAVLLYRPEDHMSLFHSLTVDFYRSSHAIIQEPLPEQTFWREDLELNTISDQLAKYGDRYSYYYEKIVDAQIFCGRRKIVEIKV